VEGSQTAKMNENSAAPTYELPNSKTEQKFCTVTEWDRNNKKD
jgi:hypothetical protein